MARRSSSSARRCCPAPPSSKIAPRCAAQVSRQPASRPRVEPRDRPERSPGTIASAKPRAAREAASSLDAVAPVVDAAEQPDQHEARAGRNLLEIEIDGIGMFQRGEIAPGAGWAARLASSAPKRAASSRKIAVGEGQKDDIGGRSARDRPPRPSRRASAFRSARDAWRLTRASMRCDARRGRGPFRRSPRAGSRRASPGLQARSKSLPEARADALHQQAHRLARDVDKALHAQDVMRARDFARAARRSASGSATAGDLDDEDCRNRRDRARPRHRDATGEWRDRPRRRRRGRAARRRRRAPSRVATIFTARGDRRASRRATRPARLGDSRSVLLSTTRSAQSKLVLVDLLERIVVIERRVGARAARATSSGSSAKRPSATAAASTTATTPSTVRRERISGQSNALTSGFGSARPEVSMTMWSGRGSRASSASIAGAKSSATVQQMQPLASSTIFSSGQVSTPQALQDLAVDADVAEFVDDQREPAAAGVSPADGGSASSCRRRESR